MESLTMSGAPLILIFQVLTLAGSLLTLYKFFRAGFYRHYRVFFWLLLFQVPNTIWPLLIRNRSSNLYLHIWTFTEPVSWVLYTLAVLELYRLVLSKHRGLYSLGRWAMYGSIALAVLISIVTLLPQLTSKKAQDSRVLNYLYATERGVFVALIVFIVLILLFLSRYPIRLSRNVLVHTGLYSVYFLCQSSAILLLIIFGSRPSMPHEEWLRLVGRVNLVITATTALCLLGWFVLLTRKGEEVQTRFPAMGPETERRVLERLDALNATLLRVSRH